jgi:hypothetical protein
MHARERLLVPQGIDLTRENDYDEQQPECDGRHNEEVGGHDLAYVVCEEGPPRL